LNGVTFPGLILPGEQLAAAQRVAGGGNNELFRVELKGYGDVAVKRYSDGGQGMSERLKREYTAVSFLNRAKISCVPTALKCDYAHGLGFYSWVDGRKLSSGDISEGEIDQVVNFLSALSELSLGEDAKDLPQAKDAGLSVESVVMQIYNRLTRFEAVKSSNLELADFLDGRYARALLVVTEKLELECRRLGIGLSKELERCYQTLSPSDYGFHNALRGKNGKLTFLDFEYFGWDDPVKMLCDFMWHPGMDLSVNCKRYFIEKAVDRFSCDPFFIMRLRLFYPLYGLIWALILLNDFLPNVWGARERAGIVTRNCKDEILQAKLEKAGAYLSRIEGGELII